ncbi:efflux RND transporter periplasmic adaptor subunit [Gallaecimonas xiamenensis]|uniref:RND family efflux transporter MFP subunit n=1 Tax=Gallaecimonas xiamenensis 3-C-1 TaxID=745411 RepID=K2IZ98_9GAMM|nr:efflux RND transporter periplasmic adaptor subunit [Gallaecimonas xiamenensis]EKE75846.1 RND family efflux transporter MFP subunit [Gallaecimonas xiamenensis 3-C-1]
MTKLFPLAGLLALATLLTACNDQAAPAAAAHPAVEVGVVTLKAGPIALQTQLQGRTSASLTAEVRPQVSGILEQRLFSEGSSVHKGQLLYQIDPASYQAAYNQAKADLLEAQAAAHTAQLKDDRYQALVRSKGVSKQDADDAHATYLQAKASVARYQAALDSAKIDLDRTQVRAPIDGRIGISSTTAGALVTANQSQALATIRSLDPIFVDLSQSAKDLLQLRTRLGQGAQAGGTEVSLTLEDGSRYPLKGQLQFKEVAVDPATGSVTLRASFPNPDGLLLPGMFVRATLTEAVERQGILAPQQGVIRDNDGSAHAWVVDQDGKVARRLVVTDRALGDDWVIRQGLADGDRLILEGTDKVRSGQVVKPLALDPLTASTGG